jgi:hypothetical protein
MKNTFTRIAALLLLAFMPMAFGLTSMAAAQDDATGAATLPVSGDIDEGAGTFQGTITGLVASEGPNGVVLDGSMSGLVLLDGQTVRITDLAFTRDIEPSVAGAGSPADLATGTPAADDGCDVLYIDAEHSFSLGEFGLDITSHPYLIDTEISPEVSDLVCTLGETLASSPDDSGTIADQLNTIFVMLGLAPVGAGTVTEEVGTPEGVTEEAVTPEVTEETTEEATEETTEEATEEATEETTEEATEETTEEATEESTEEATKPILEPEEPTGTPGN